MKNCLKCQANIPNQVIIDGKEHYLNNRKYCLTCSPFGCRNTKKLHLSDDELAITNRNYSKLNKEDRAKINAITYKFQKYKRSIRKIELVNELGGCCSNCGYDKNLSALTFHHVSPEEKLFGLDTRKMYAKSMDELRREVAKCVLLCHNCHTELHNPDFNDWQNTDLTLRYGDFK